MAILATLHALVTTPRRSRPAPVVRATDDELLELAEAFGVVRTPADDPTTCPAWCALPDGHAAEQVGAGATMTVHRTLAPTTDGGRLVDVAAYTFVRADGTTATYSPFTLVDQPTADVLAGGAA